MNRPNKEGFGLYLKQLRVNLKRSQESVARDVGVSLTYYNKLERGTADPPSAETLERLVSVLGADRDTLYHLAGKIPAEVLETVRSHPKRWPEIRSWPQAEEGDES